MSPRRRVFRERSLVAVVLTAGLLGRLIAIPFIGDRYIPYEWGTLARNLVQGRGFCYFEVLASGEIAVSRLADGSTPLPSAYMPPLYAFAMAGLLKLLGSELAAATAAAIIQAFLGAATAWLVYKSARIVLGSPASVWALAVYSFFPLAIYSSAQVSAVVLYVFLAQLSLWLLLEWRYGESAGTLKLVGSGLAAGLLMLARGEGVLSFALMLSWLLLVGASREPPGRSRLKARLQACGWFAVPAVTVVIPWVVRNFLVFGRLTSLTVSGGYNLWQGQNVGATGIHGGSVSPPVVESSTLQQLIGAIPPSNAYELTRDNLYLSDALHAVASDPLRSLGLGMLKAFMYWTNLYPGVSINYPGAQSPLVVVPWLIVVALAVLGVFASRSTWRRAILLHAYVIINTLVVMAFFVMPRYNLTVLPCVAMFAGSGLAWLTKMVSDHRKTVRKSNV